MMQYLTIKEARELAHCGRWTISRWIKAGFIRAVKIDGSIRIEVELLHAFLDAKIADTMMVKS